MAHLFPLEIWLCIFEDLFDRGETNFLRASIHFRTIFRRSVRRTQEIEAQFRTSQGVGASIARLSTLLRLGRDRKLNLHLHFRLNSLPECDNATCGPREESLYLPTEAAAAPISPILIPVISPHMGILHHFSVTVHSEGWQEDCKALLDGLMVHHAPRLTTIHLPPCYRPSVYHHAIQAENLVALHARLDALTILDDASRLVSVNLILSFSNEEAWERLSRITQLQELGLLVTLNWMSEMIGHAYPIIHLSNLRRIHLYGECEFWLNRIHAPNLHHFVTYTSCAIMALADSPLAPQVQTLQPHSTYQLVSYRFLRLSLVIVSQKTYDELGSESNGPEFRIQNTFHHRFNWDSLRQTE